jgi:hypothetical protein
LPAAGKDLMNLSRVYRFGLATNGSDSLLSLQEHSSGYASVFSAKTTYQIGAVTGQPYGGVTYVAATLHNALANQTDCLTLQQNASTGATRLLLRRKRTHPDGRQDSTTVAQGTLTRGHFGAHLVVCFADGRCWTRAYRRNGSFVERGFSHIPLIKPVRRGTAYRTRPQLLYRRKVAVRHRLVRHERVTSFSESTHQPGKVRAFMHFALFYQYEKLR